MSHFFWYETYTFPRAWAQGGVPFIKGFKVLFVMSANLVSAVVYKNVYLFTRITLLQISYSQIIHLSIFIGMLIVS
jgi:hypothetical protein